jgi:hypothetical protein
MLAAVIAANHSEGRSLASDVSSARNARKASRIGGIAASYPSE